MLYFYLTASVAAIDVSLLKASIESSMDAISQKLLWVHSLSVRDPECDKYVSAMITL